MTELQVRDVRYRATVQDLGRFGFAHLGVPTAGAVDRASLREANRIVGNDESEAAIEVLLGGFRFTVEDDLPFAVVGAEWSVDGSTVSVGSTVGTYAYVAVAGGIDVAPVLGSRSADTLSGLGPPPLQVGDVLAVGTRRATSQGATIARDDGPLRVVVGPRDEWFTEEAVQRLLAAEWTVTPSSDRTGLRLSGPALHRRSNDELPSEGMVSGAIQVPPDGQPIVFLANSPTTGGYPVIAVVVSDDVDRAAQVRPGGLLRFRTLTSVIDC